MKKVNSPVVSVSLKSYHQLSDANEQTGLSNNSTDAYLQNEELSSIGGDSQRTMGTSLPPVHCSNLGDVQVALKSGAKDVEIPDNVYRELIEAAEKGGHLDNPGELGQNGGILLDYNNSIGLPPFEDDT